MIAPMKTVLIAAVVLLAATGVAIILAPAMFAWWQGGRRNIEPLAGKLPVELETIGLAVLGLAVAAALWVALR